MSALPTLLTTPVRLGMGSLSLPCRCCSHLIARPSPPRATTALTGVVEPALEGAPQLVGNPPAARPIAGAGRRRDRNPLPIGDATLAPHVLRADRLATEAGRSRRRRAVARGRDAQPAAHETLTRIVSAQRFDKNSLQRYLCTVHRTPADDIRAVRALAHPLRLELLDLLRFEGPATATLLARRVGESSGATSYHLRQLAKYGYIEETPRQAGRERWWQYRERPVHVGHGETANRRLLAEVLSREAHALDRYLADPRPDPQWDQAAFFRSVAVRLTVAELDQLGRSIEALIAPLRRANADAAPAGALPVRLLAFGFPSLPGGSSDDLS